MKTDTERLNWIAENSCAIRKGGHKSPDPYYFVIFRDGTTANEDNDFRVAIDYAMDLHNSKSPAKGLRQDLRLYSP